jgi:hypothetical protein
MNGSKKGETRLMKGTAILFQGEHGVKILENIDKAVYEEIRKQCGCVKCTCSLKQEMKNYNYVTRVLWQEDQVDWDYGY